MLRFIRANSFARGALAVCGTMWLVAGCGSADGTTDTQPPAGNADIRIQVSVCPLIGSLTAQPLRTRVGDDIALTATSSDVGDAGDAGGASDASALSFAWYSSSGTFRDATAASTTFVCVRAGSQSIYLFVNNGTCGDLAEVPITCDDDSAN
jgi:hypothetical protein